MWIFSSFGFFSIVRDRNNPAHYMVRARERTDLAVLKSTLKPEGFKSGPIIETLDADYPFRIIVTKPSLEVLLVKHANSIDYPNFKSMIRKVFGATREHLYHEVWLVMRRLNRLPTSFVPRAKPRKR